MHVLIKKLIHKPKKFNIQEINVNGDGRTAFLIKKR